MLCRWSKISNEIPLTSWFFFSPLTLFFPLKNTSSFSLHFKSIRKRKQEAMHCGQIWRQSCASFQIVLITFRCMLYERPQRCQMCHGAIRLDYIPTFRDKKNSGTKPKFSAHQSRSCHQNAAFRPKRFKFWQEFGKEAALCRDSPK